MPVGFGSLEVARSGLYVNERALHVTGHNISNVNTPGFTRQQAIMATARYETYGKFQLGLGADIQQVRQIRHMFLDNLYRKESTPLGYYETRYKTFQDIQAILGEPSEDGLQNTINRFWDSWQELAKDPSSLTARALVRQRAQSLVAHFNHIGQQLDKLQMDLDNEIKVRVAEINDITQKIARLNTLIAQTELAGDNANDYNDQRNLLMDKLSRLVDCDMHVMSDGQVDIVIGGRFIVSKNKAFPVTLERNYSDSGFSAPYVNGEPLKVKGGVLKGLLESRGEVRFHQGSLTNGGAVDKINLVFAFNLEDTQDKRDELLSNIDKIVKEYRDKGFDVRLGLVAFDSSGLADLGSPSGAGTAFYNSVEDFKTNLSSLAFTSAGASAKLQDVLQDIAAKTENEDLVNGWFNSGRHIVLMSDSAISYDDADKQALETISRGMRELNFDATIISNHIVFNNLTAKLNARKLESTGIKMDEELIESLRNVFYGGIKETNNIIPDLRKRLNLIVNAIAHEVNALHRSGYTLGDDSHTGLDFFVPIKPGFAMEIGNIKLNDALMDLKEIAASYDSSSGDNSIALAISNLRYKAVLGGFGQVESINSFYHSIIMNVGKKGAEAQRIAQSQEILVKSIDDKRTSISGVSMDEEMSNMLKFQFAYGASARVMNVLDEMFDQIVNRMGIVGR